MPFPFVLCLVFFEVICHRIILQNSQRQTNIFSPFVQCIFRNLCGKYCREEMGMYNNGIFTFINCVLHFSEIYLFKTRQNGPRHRQWTEINRWHFILSLLKEIGRI